MDDGALGRCGSLRHGFPATPLPDTGLQTVLPAVARQTYLYLRGPVGHPELAANVLLPQGQAATDAMDSVLGRTIQLHSRQLHVHSDVDIAHPQLGRALEPLQASPGLSIHSTTIGVAKYCVRSHRYALRPV